ncbi:MAG TPA: hypothetical protein PLZ75_01625 [Bacteroidales bacterium]|jgi:hypothetical protein|nr:hypothetical protein [Bacteroidales bacterium]HQH23772.1 hypothetical protein [Bacteroidales bacterium]HQJ81597.1 hypothetical protein [Bacteroidales bacterium]
MQSATISADVEASSSLPAGESDKLAQYIHNLFERIQDYQTSNNKGAIRICLSSFNLYAEGDNKNDLERSGCRIDAIERLMTFTLVMLQQYIIIAAKPVLRYTTAKQGKPNIF